MTSEQPPLDEFTRTDNNHSDWEEVVFSEVISINDYPSAEKGEEYRSVGMSDVAENQRKIEDWEYKNYSYSRPRFRNGQTLMARITPCLENGKTAFVDILNDNEVAIGSTEFIVLSANNKTTSKFVYYTARRPEIRQFAIKRMTGTSGRQRVPLDIFDDKTIKLPPLEEQKKIVTVLDTIDSKIEVNNQTSNYLKRASRCLFESLFIEFEQDRESKNSGDEKIPEEFEKGLVEDIVDLRNGDPTPEPDGEIPVYGGNGITDYTSKASEHANVVVIGRVGAYCGNVHRTYQPSWISDNAIRAKPKDNSKSINFIYHLIQSLNLEKLRHGTSQPLISQTDLLNQEILIPPQEEIEKFENIVRPLFKKIGLLKRENEILGDLRDTLLPKLMSGEIRADEIELHNSDNSG